MTSQELHIISTGRQAADTLVSIVSEIHRHIDFLHLREPDWSDQKMMRVVQSLEANGFPMQKLVINHRVDMARQSGAHGVQLGFRSLDASQVKKECGHLRIGCSVHSVDEAIYSAEQGADYLMYGHIFQTASKPGQQPKGVENLERMTGQVAVPVIAIGGITPGNATEVMQCGASGVAVLSGILLAKDPRKAVQEYRRALTETRRENEETL